MKAIALFLTLATVLPTLAEERPAYRVIVHPENPIQTVERRFLADAFLKKSSHWPNGEAIRPVDLESESSVRRRFSQDLLKRTTAAVRIYWQQRLFSGRGVPPPELSTDAEVVRYVLKHRGAVGYVAGTADVGGAKVVAVD
jgi:hypothetical protein